MKSATEKDDWDLVISSKNKWWDLQLSDIFKYRDLLFLFVRRDFVSVYKQSILGPLWYIIQPVFSTVVYTLIFDKVAKIPTDGIPSPLFYMTGITAWNYFSSCLNNTSSTFVNNAGIFGKVYFPRMVVPLSVIISNLIKFGIQFLLLTGFIVFYYINGATVHLNSAVLLTPLLIVIMAIMGLAMGIIISSMTTKYRDFQYFVGFGVQLMMYATPIVYPLSILEGKLRTAALLNPMTSVIETFKYAWLGGGELNLLSLGYSFFVTILLLLLGLIIFHKVEKTFMDTV